MQISLIKQYSIFLKNQPGALKAFAELFVRENIDIIAISQDLRYDSAVVRLAIASDNEEVIHAITKAGFTSVKTDALCIEFKNRVGAIRDIGAALGDNGINITNLYGSSCEENSRIVVLVNEIEKAMEVLEKSGLFD